MPDYHKAASITDLEPGAIICVDVAGTRVALYNLEGEYFATSPSCTHVEADLADGDIEGGEVVCPLHYATFDIRTGLCTGPPADEDLVTYNVRVNGQDIEVEL